MPTPLSDGDGDAGAGRRAEGAGDALDDGERRRGRPGDAEVAAAVLVGDGEAGHGGGGGRDERAGRERRAAVGALADVDAGAGGVDVDDGDARAHGGDGDHEALTGVDVVSRSTTGRRWGWRCAGGRPGRAPSPRTRWSASSAVHAAPCEATVCAVASMRAKSSARMPLRRLVATTATAGSALSLCCAAVRSAWRAVSGMARCTVRSRPAVAEPSCRQYFTRALFEDTAGASVEYMRRWRTVLLRPRRRSSRGTSPSAPSPSAA